MDTTSIIRHLLIDNESLLEYNQGILVDYSSVKRRLFLLERNESKVVPDHYYKLVQEKTFRNLKDSLSSTLTKGLTGVARENLELRGRRIYVKQDRQNNWQDLITRMPPLVLQAALINDQFPLVAGNIVEFQEYTQHFILPNVKYTALPYPYLPKMEEYMTSNNGLYDLHMHLNGATEADSAWQDFLDTPEKIYAELKKGFEDQLVKEQFEQETNLLTPLRFYSLIRVARQIRNCLFRIVCHDYVCQSTDSCEMIHVDSPHHLLLKMLDINAGEYDRYGNPFAELLGQTESDSSYPLVVECLMYIKVFRYLSDRPRESVSNLFHFYLLILGLANRLLVQQTHQYGFQQFKKHTIDELRTESERTYYKRFLQLQGNELRNLRFLEGRFSPKDSQSENELLLSKILDGWGNLLRLVETTNVQPELKLIAHFIKEEDEDFLSDFRHKRLRSRIWNKATVLGIMNTNQHPILKDLVGIDAASSEFDAPPEVFAPSFRMLRRRGIKNFTFHAGEDFFHIIGGLRAIYETIDFLDFQNGDRIGHAVASGLDPLIWKNNVGDKILIRKGDYMDDLLFAFHFIITNDICELKSYLPFIANKISDLSYEVYSNYYPTDLLIKAWKLRKYCPMMLLSGARDFAEPFRVFCEEEYAEIRGIVQNPSNDNRAELISLYHCPEIREKYKEIIEIKTEDILSLDGIRVLQKGILKFMHDREIVIETLPTSNVRIGNHRNFRTYHLITWIKWKEEGFPVPPIVVGTDDTGIFATNIYNEYSNIYCLLTHYHKMSHDKVMNLIKEFDQNAKVYRFK